MVDTSVGSGIHPFAATWRHGAIRPEGLSLDPPTKSWRGACRNSRSALDLGGSELLTLRNPSSKGHFVDAIVAYGGQDAGGVR
jgi:hypothetical protein